MSRVAATVSQLLVALIVAIGFPHGLLAQDSQAKIDLNQAKQYAIDHNNGVVALRHALDAARARKERVGSAFLPRLGIAAGAEADTTGDKNEGGGIGYVYGSLNLFNGYRDVRRLEIADLEIEKAEVQVKGAEFQVGLDVEEFFHQYLFKKALIEIKGKETALNDEHQQYVKRSRAMGSISETDVMEFQLKEATLKSDMIALKQELEDTRSNLRRLFGEEIGGKVEPVGSLQHQHVRGDLQDFLAKIQRFSPKVVILSREVAIARAEQRVNEGRSLPEIDLETRAGYLPIKDRIDGNRPQASVMLVAKMELFSGRDASWEAREKTANAFKAEAELKDEINVAIRNLEMGYRHLKFIEARGDLEKDNSDFARRYYQSVLGEYRRGFKNSSDLALAAERWYETQRRKIQFEFDFIQQRVAVEKALGAAVEVEVGSK